MASALSRNARYFSAAHRLIVLRSLTRCPSSIPTPTSPLLHNPVLPFLLPLRRSPVPFSAGILGIPLYHNMFFGTSSGSPSNSEASSSSEEAKPEGEDKTEGAKSQGGDNSGDSQQGRDAGKSVRGGPVSWLSFLLLVVTGAGILFYYDKQKKRRIEEINRSSAAVKEGPSAGNPEIGGPFNLVNHEGKPATEKDFKGKWTVIYFGFTHCPDICPDELQKLVIAVDKIKEKSGLEIVPVFISIDPERDTVEQVHEYVKEFHPNLVGLTGNPEEIKKAARAFRIYYMKTAEEDSDYLVDHSIIMHLMNPDMKFVKYFGKNEDVQSLADNIIKEIKKHKAEQHKVK